MPAARSSTGSITRRFLKQYASSLHTAIGHVACPPHHSQAAPPSAHPPSLCATWQVRLKQHLVFDGTGKSLLNTCGRVISRLRAAGYRIHLCVVLASFDTCVANIADRKMRTGRDVPLRIVRETFEMLRTAIDVYIDRHSEVADRVLFYNNDHRAMNLEATLCRGRADGEADARAAADKYLAPTWLGDLWTPS